MKGAYVPRYFALERLLFRLLLYHGTNESNLSDILANGIRPRLDGDEGNHAGTTPEIKSRDGMVYLASTGPVQYASMAKGDGRLLILEVETDRLDHQLMLPDEDSVAHEILRNEGVKWGADYLRRFPQVVPTVNQFEHKDRWQELLDKSGSVAHNGIISPQAITRYVLIDRVAAPKFFEAFEMMCFLAGAQQGMGQKFRALPAFIFDGHAEPLFEGNDLTQIEGLLNTLRHEWETAFEVVTL